MTLIKDIWCVGHLKGSGCKPVLNSLIYIMIHAIPYSIIMTVYHPRTAGYVTNCISPFSDGHMAATRVCLHLAVSQLESCDHYPFQQVASIYGEPEWWNLVCVFRISAVFSPF